MVGAKEMRRFDEEAGVNKGDGEAQIEGRKVGEREFPKKSAKKGRTNPQFSYQVTSRDMRPFDEQRWELADKVAERKKRYADENHLKATIAYDFLEGECRISVDTLKKSINGTLKISRTFLYKFAVGLRMSIEEANEYFCLCGGPLNAQVREDFICIRALEDGDSIELFVQQFEEFTGNKIDIREWKSPIE